MRRTLLSILFAALTLAASAGAAELQVDAPSSARMGEPVKISVRVVGAEPGTQVMLYHRGKGAPSYTARPMRPDGGSFQTAIPETATRATELLYYVEVRTGDTQMRLGSPDHPASILLLEVEPVSQTKSYLGWVGLVALTTVVAAALLWKLNARRCEALRDRLFWARTLRHLVRLSAEDAARGVEDIAATTLQHPETGPLNLRTEAVAAKLEEVKRWDFARLEADRKRMLGPSVPSLEPPPEAPAEKDREKRDLAELTTKVGHLAAAAWFLAHGGGAEESSAEDLVKPLLDCLDTTRRIQAALKEGKVEEARKELEAVSGVVERLKRSVAMKESACTPESIVFRLSSGSPVTPDVLGRLIEYYALHAKRTPAHRDKIVILVRALVARDAGDPTTAESVKQSLARRQLLASAAMIPFPKSLSGVADSLQGQIEGTKVAASAELEPFGHLLRGFEDSLGRSFYTLDGLARVVALRGALEAKKADVERLQLRALEQTSADAVAMAARTADMLVTEADVETVELAVARHLADVELALMEAIESGAPEDRGYFLDKAELEAATGASSVSKWADLVLRSTACRTAIDELARRHARARQPEGQEPPPLPVELARGLIRAASFLETDLNEQIERDKTDGMHERARDTVRLVQRLSRARLGLAVLGDLHPDGLEKHAEPAARATPSAPDGSGYFNPSDLVGSESDEEPVLVA